MTGEERVDAAIAIKDCFEKKRPLPEDFKDRLQLTSPERGVYLSKNLQNALPAISLCSHTSLLSAISNDMNADLVYSQQIAGYGKKGDVLFVISTSGNSQNVVYATTTAEIQEYHLPIYHTLCRIIENQFF